MSCRLYSDKIMKYFDGTLNGIETAQLKQHLKICKECSNEFDDLSAIMSAIEAGNTAEPPPDFEKQVMEKIAQIEPAAIKKSSNITALVIILSTIALMLSAGIVVLYLNSTVILETVKGLLAADSPASDMFGVLSDIFTAFSTLLKDIMSVMIQVGIVFIKTYYYVIVFLLVMLFAIQWMLITLIRQNGGGSTR